jgi:Resolvase, N terminal domain
MLARLLREIRAGETLVVVRLDRLARSVSHLLAVIGHLEAAGSHFRSLRDPIDTFTPQAMFSLQVLGPSPSLSGRWSPRAHAAVSAVIQACARWSERHPQTARKPRRRASGRRPSAAGHLLPTVRQMRPNQPWGDVVRVLNRGQATTWTVERLRRTVRRLADEGIIEASLLDRARP